MSHTEEFLRSLKDPTKHKCVRDVAVFRPHRRTLPAYTAPDGTEFPEIRIDVTVGDLHTIARSTNESGPQVMTEGHRNPAPDLPESAQPRKCGWVANFQSGMHLFGNPDKGPEPAILADLYYDLSLWREVGPHRYPFRSVDYDFREKRLTGLALLVRRPFLDLGVLPYRYHVVPYSLETEAMPEVRMTEHQMKAALEYAQKNNVPYAAAHAWASANVAPNPPAESRMTQRQMDEALRYMRGNRVEWAVAYQYAMSNIPAGPEAETPLTQNQMVAALRYQQERRSTWAEARTWAIQSIPAS